MSDHFFGFFQSLVMPPEMQAPAPGWQPSTDVYRTPKGWLIKFDVAGVRPEDVEVTVSGNRLSVRGIRRDSCLEEGCQCYQMEIAYSRFERHLTLPTDLARARVDAEHRQGMLLVRIHLEEPRS
jgi:HSP20 family protein